MPRKTVGDLIRQKVVPPKASANISVEWTWSNESQGLVQWSFKNNSAEQVAFVLYRNGYYFCGAFGASIYVANPQFGISYAPSAAPLTDLGAQSNAPPLGIVGFPNGTSVVCFVFVLAPGAAYSMLEGGFSSLTPPNGATIYELSNPVPETYCIGYDPASVSQWNLQSGESLSGGPNPGSQTAVSWSPPSDAPVSVEFPVTVVAGACSSTSPPPTPVPGGCLAFLDQASIAYQAGDYAGAVEDVLSFVFCLIDGGVVNMGTMLKAVVDRARSRHFL